MGKRYLFPVLILKLILIHLPLSPLSYLGNPGMDYINRVSLFSFPGLASIFFSRLNVPSLYLEEEFNFFFFFVTVLTDFVNVLYTLEKDPPTHTHTL